MNVQQLVRIGCVALLVAMGNAGGCRTSPWQTNLSGGPETAEPRQDGTFVRFREVPWERVETTLATLKAEVSASTTHPDEWSPEQKQAHKAKLLEGLQISEPAAGVRVVGKSEFRTTDKLHTPSEEMQAVANGLGADTVVWSSKLLGKADRVVQEPITVFTDGTYWRDGRSRSVTETQTGWVPVKIQVDEKAYIAFFLRCR